MAAKGQLRISADATLIHSVPGPDGGSVRSRPSRETLRQSRRANDARREPASKLRRECCANRNPPRPASPTQTVSCATCRTQQDQNAQGKGRKHSASTAGGGPRELALLYPASSIRSWHNPPGRRCGDRHFQNCQSKNCPGWSCLQCSLKKSSSLYSSRWQMTSNLNGQ